MPSNGENLKFIPISLHQSHGIEACELQKMTILYLSIAHWSVTEGFALNFTRTVVGKCSYMNLYSNFIKGSCLKKYNDLF